MDDVNLISARGTYGAATKDVVYAQSTKAIWCTVAGNVSFVGANQDDTTVLPSVPLFQWIPLNAKKINTSGTTATIGLVLFHAK